LFQIQNKNIENSLKKQIEILEKQNIENIKNIKNENQDIINQLNSKMKIQKDEFDEQKNIIKNENQKLLDNLNLQLKNSSENNQQQFLKYKNELEKMKQHEIQIITEKNENEINILKDQNNYLNQQLTNFQNLKMFLNNTKTKGCLGETKVMEILNNHYKEHEFLDNTHTLGNGDIIGNINNTRFFIEIKTHSDSTLKKTFQAVNKNFIQTALSSFELNETDFAILCYPNLKSIPIKKKNHNKYCFDNSMNDNTIEVDFLTTSKGKQFPIFYCANVFEYDINLLICIKAGLRLTREIKNINFENLKANFIKIQKLLYDLNQKHENSLKLIKLLKDDFEKQGLCIHDLINLLLSEKNNDNEEEQNENYIKSDLKKIYNFLKENNIMLNKKNIIENFEKYENLNLKLSKTSIKNLSIKAYLNKIIEEESIIIN
jgi:hypothetical protein